MKIQPIGNRVLVQPCEPDKQSKGGILLPDMAKEKPQMGTILEVGPGKTLEDGSVKPLTLRKGDKVLYSRYAGNSTKELGDNLLMDADEILAKVEA